MDTASVKNHSVLFQLKLFLALSRASHALLDIATPCLAALLWLGAFPPLTIVFMGIGTAIAGYLAVYALNDVVDYRLDRKKIARGELASTGNDLDAVFVRHPMAHGLLRVKEGILWAATWALLALVGAYLLNPVCAIIFIASIILESVYCLLLQVSYLRTVISGVVKTLGGVAAVFAVDPHPAFLFLAVLFLWLFCWEIGGQNIPNDLTDREEDAQLRAKTIPVKLGSQGAASIILVSLVIAVMLSGALFWFAADGFGISAVLGAFAIGIYFLLMPAWKLYKTQLCAEAAALFNRSSYYPLAVLIMITARIIFFEQ